MLTSGFLLPRHNRVIQVLPGHAVNDNSEASLEKRPHWRIIGNYRLMFGGTHNHITDVLMPCYKERSYSSKNTYVTYNCEQCNSYVKCAWVAVLEVLQFNAVTPSHCRTVDDGFGWNNRVDHAREALKKILNM